MGKAAERAARDAALPSDPPAKTPRPERSEEELERMRAARKRNVQRHVAVSVQINEHADGSISLEPPHDDGRGWLIRLQDAFGTASDDVAMGRLRELVNMVPKGHTAPKYALNTMVAAVDGVRPETELEGALAVQMAGTHQLAMQCLSNAACATTVEQREAAGNIATKMLRTYTMQVEALAKLRRGGEQKVKVEHVHVYQGGQAIVGNVEQSGGRGAIENGRQPHALAGTATLAISDGSTVLCPNKDRVGVSESGGIGEVSMPDARRRQG